MEKQLENTKHCNTYDKTLKKTRYHKHTQSEKHLHIAREKMRHLKKNYIPTDFENHLNSEEQKRSREKKWKWKKCSLCERNIFSNYLEKHENSNKHKMNMKTEPKVKIIKRKKFCDICNIWISRSNPTHEDKKPKQSLRKKMKPTHLV